MWDFRSREQIFHNIGRDFMTTIIRPLPRACFCVNWKSTVTERAQKPLKWPQFDTTLPSYKANAMVGIWV